MAAIAQYDAATNAERAALWLDSSKGYEIESPRRAACLQTALVYATLAQADAVVDAAHILTEAKTHAAATLAGIP